MRVKVVMISKYESFQVGQVLSATRSLAEKLLSAGVARRSNEPAIETAEPTQPEQAKQKSKKKSEA